MPPEAALPAPAFWRVSPSWRDALVRLAAAWLALALLTASDWVAMAHQWWNIDTYNHVILVPGILAWLVWLRREELPRIEPRAWAPGVIGLATALTVWLLGRALEINLVAQLGVVAAFQCAAAAVLGLRATLILAFPLAYATLLVPFGDEMIPALQQLTAGMTVALTHLSGVPAVVEGLYIDTPAGRFVVAEECSGVKFLIAMTALTILAGWTGFRGWRPRVLLVAAGAVVSILANGVRAWGTIYVAQFVGAERAGGFDHIVYGWVFFAVVTAAVMAFAWPRFDREPGEAGLTAAEIERMPVVTLERTSLGPGLALAGIAGLTIAFAAAVRLV